MRRIVTVAAAALALAAVHPHAARADAAAGDMAFSSGDYASAYREWTEAANAGDPSAMAAVGTLYDIGHGVPQDFAAALEWYRRAAGAGSVRAMFNVAAMYDSGRGTRMDRAVAVRWYRAAAAGGNARAAYNLGAIYRDGDGVPHDDAAAVGFFRIAAAAGLEAAAANLAALGHPLPPRPARAAMAARAPAAAPADVGMFQKAALERGAVGPIPPRTMSAIVGVLADQAAKGNPLADYDLGFAYERGVGLARDPVRSYVYYLRATASPAGNVRSAATSGAAAIGVLLTAGQHAAARDMLVSGSP